MRAASLHAAVPPRGAIVTTGRLGRRARPTAIARSRCGRVPGVSSALNGATGAGRKRASRVGSFANRFVACWPARSGPWYPRQIAAAGTQSWL
jgi:hypothetical protein